MAFNKLTQKINPAYLNTDEALTSDDPQASIASQGYSNILNSAPVQKALDVSGNLKAYDDDTNASVKSMTDLVRSGVASNPEADKKMAERSLNVAMGSLKPMAAAPAVEEAEAVGPAFYSKLQQLLEEKMGPSATPQQVEGVASAAKPEEIKYLKLKEYLQGKEKVNKDELLAHLKSNEPQITDIVKGGQRPDAALMQKIKQRTGKDSVTFDDMSDAEYKEYQDLVNKQKEPAPTKFDQYTLPGGENYKETLHTLPENSGKLPDGFEMVEDKAVRPDSINRFKIIQKGDPEQIAVGQGFGETSEEALKNFSHERGEGTWYKSSHYDEPNILAHSRTNDRVDAAGNKHLFLEELQSDWHQAGRKQGYKPENAQEVANNKIKIEDINKQIDDIEQNLQEGPRPGQGSSTSLELRKKLVDLNNQRASIMGSKGEGVPDAPFKKTWQELGLKKALRQAAEEGKDNISWTTGEQQAQRYDLSKQVDKINVTKTPEGTFDIHGYEPGNHERHTIASSVPQDKLSDYLGKDLAAKVSPDKEKQLFTGADLKVGGEGMKGFYDKIIPDFMNKFGKKFGQKVEQANLVTQPAGENGLLTPVTTQVHTLKITPEMRKEILKKGFPLFTGAAMLGGEEEPKEDMSALMRRKF